MKKEKTKIGLGIVTYNRPEYLKQSIQGVIDHLLDAVDVCYLYNDGSEPKYAQAYQEIYDTLPDKIRVIHADQNKGVSVSKNTLLRNLIEDGCGHLFLLEDDVIPKSRKAITYYIAAAKMKGISHLMWAHHGPANKCEPMAIDGPLVLWPNGVGAWTYYTAGAIKTAGYMDEKFTNAVEHIEHTYRITKHNMHPLLCFGYADVIGSEEWLEEIPGAIENSSIRTQDKWNNNVIEGLRYWKRKDPEFPFDRWLALEEEKCIKSE